MHKCGKSEANHGEQGMGPPPKSSYMATEEHATPQKKFQQRLPSK